MVGERSDVVGVVFGAVIGMGRNAGAWDEEKQLGVVDVRKAGMGRVARDKPALAAGRKSFASADGARRSRERDRSARMPRALQ